MATGNDHKVDLEKVINTWAKDYFVRIATRKERKLMKKGVVSMEIDWERVKFVHDQAQYKPAPDPGEGTPTNKVLFKTTFTNRTNQPQTYSFHTERTTQSSCTTEVEECYLTGVDMNVKLSIPGDILELSAGFKREITLKKAESQTVEEELTWGVNSQVQVEPRHVGEAKLAILEEEYRGGFEVTTHISGMAKVIFTNLKKNNSFVKAIENKIVDIAKQAIAEHWIQPSDAFYVDTATQSILSRTKGRCHFRFGTRQIFEVDQEPISQ